MPSEHGLPSVKQLRHLGKEHGLSIKNKTGSQLRTLDKVTSAKLAGASPAVIDAAQLEQSTQRATEDRPPLKNRKRLFAGIEDV